MKTEDSIPTGEIIEMTRRFSNAFVMAGYRPKENSDNPLEALLFDAMALIHRLEAEV